MTAKTFFIHALTPVHVGIGQGVGFIDLPIMREPTTNLPIVPGSSIKGVLADYFNADETNRVNDPMKRAAFGLSGEDNANSGSLVFTDARLLLLPVRSLYGTFAWVTSPMTLERFYRDCNSAGIKIPGSIPGLNNYDNVLGADSNCVIQNNNTVFFEDFNFKFRHDSQIQTIANSLAESIFPNDQNWKQEFLKRFAVIHDDIFNYLCETAMDVRTRIRIQDDTKVVKKGALWMEESLPAESILAGLVWCDKVYIGGQPSQSITPANLFSQFCNGTLTVQVGGHATIGRGRARMIFK